MSRTINLALISSLLFFMANIAQADAGVGEQIYKHCKVCHGVKGWGGKEGKYPRIAGLPQYYLEKQLADFKGRKRINKPMVPVFKNWRFNQDAITAVSAFVSQLSLAGFERTHYEPSPEVLAQFDGKDEMLEVGEDIFQDCIQCHGEQARGKEDKESPPLVNQYPNYLRKQIVEFASGHRTHENSESLFGELETDEIEALLAYLNSQAD